MSALGEPKVHLQVPPHLNMVMEVDIRGCNIGGRRKGEWQVGLNAKRMAHTLVLIHEQVAKHVGCMYLQ